MLKHDQTSNFFSVVARMKAFCAVVAVLGLAACAGPPKPGSEAGKTGSPSSGAGRYYLDDGPGERPISELEKLPDAVPRSEPLHPRANRPYVVFGQSYQPMTRLEPFRERGTATWYGRRYHDRPTSIGERYDMYAMTAAHPRLPLPSYARVTNLRNGRTVVVRVNDRGPFLHGRVIDLSFAAAARLGFARGGSAEVEVELITDAESFNRMASAQPPAPLTTAAPAPVGEAPVTPQTSVLSPTPTPISTQLSASTPAIVSAPERTPVASFGAVPHVQIGAYGNRDNAEAARRGLEPRLRPLGLTLLVRSEGNLHRLVAGPFPRLADAAQAARDIRSMTGIEAIARPR